MTALMQEYPGALRVTSNRFSMYPHSGMLRAWRINALRGMRLQSRCYH